MAATEYTKSFVTSVVVGKDVVPRIGLHQMESLRADLMHAIKRSKDPKVCCQFFLVYERNDVTNKKFLLLNFFSGKLFPAQFFVAVVLDFQRQLKSLKQTIQCKLSIRKIKPKLENLFFILKPVMWL